MARPYILPFDKFKLGDLSFHLAVGPWLRDGGMYRWLVVGNSVGETRRLGFVFDSVIKV